MNEEQEERVRDSLLRSLRVTKEHNDRQIEVLLDHINDDIISVDLPFVGSKYQNRIKQFEALQYENMGLKEEMRRLQQQVNTWKNTPFDSVLRQEEFLNKESADKGQAVSQTRMGITQTSSREQYKQKMEDIQKLKAQARESQQGLNIKTDELIGRIIKYVQYGYTKNQLEKQIKHIKHEENCDDMISVPRRRYQQLIQIYSINMSDICAKELMNIKKDSVQEINFRNQSQQKYKQKYANIITDNLQITNLEVFFRMLANKFGFEKQWQRYHTNNMNEAINLKSKLQSIIGNRLLKVIPQQEKQQEQPLQQSKQNQRQIQLQKKMIKGEMRRKLNEIVDILPFNSIQKQYWKELTEKIHTDSLINIQSLKKVVDEINTKKEEKLGEQISSFVSHTFEKWSQRVTSLLESRYHKKISCIQMLKNYSRKEEIQKKLKEKQANSRVSIWQLSKSVTGQILEKIAKQLNKSLLFVSTRQLSRNIIHQG